MPTKRNFHPGHPTQTLLLKPVVKGSRQLHPRARYLVQYAPEIASIFLIALIAVESFRVATLILGDRPPFVPNPVNLNLQLPKLNIRDFRATHLFDKSEDLIVASNVVRSTVDDIVLRGMISTDAPIGGRAIISEAGVPRVLKVGDVIGRATLRFVYLNHVDLTYDGKWVTLTLPLNEIAPEPKVIENQVAVALEDDSAEGIKSIGEAISASPYVDDVSQQLSGFLIRPNKVRHAFFMFGLQEQDLVISVNGVMVVDADKERSEKLIDLLLNSAQGVITVMRAGVPRDFSLDTDLAGSKVPLR